MKYRTDFTTFKEYQKIILSVPEENLQEWADSLTKEQLSIRITREEIEKTGFLESIIYQPYNGTCIAHILTNNCPEMPKHCRNETMLRLPDKEGRTVAHWSAYCGNLPEEFMTPEILSIRSGNGRSVLHDMAECIGEKRETDSELFASKWLPLLDSLLTMENTAFKDHSGLTVAHILAEYRCLPVRFHTQDILSCATESGDTVAGAILQSVYLKKVENIRWEELFPEVLLTAKQFDGDKYDNFLQFLVTYPAVYNSYPGSKKMRTAEEQEELFSGLSRIPAESLRILTEDIKDNELQEMINRIIRFLDESEVFER